MKNVQIRFEFITEGRKMNSRILMMNDIERRKFETERY